MVNALKLVSVPAVAAYGLLSTVTFNASNIGAIVGVASLFGAVAIVFRYREALAVAEKESAIYVARDLRLSQEHALLTDKVRDLEERPNLASHAALLKEMSDNLREHSRQSIDENVKRQQRDERIIALLDMLVDRTSHPDLN